MRTKAGTVPQLVRTSIVQECKKNGMTIGELCRGIQRKKYNKLVLKDVERLRRELKMYKVIQVILTHGYGVLNNNN